MDESHFLNFFLISSLTFCFCGQDFTGVPAVVDLACMRDAMNKLGGDYNKINPLVELEFSSSTLMFTCC